MPSFIVHPASRCLSLFMFAAAVSSGCASIDLRKCKGGDAARCTEVVNHYGSEPPIEPEQLAVFAKMCEGGRPDACENLARLCAANGDGECVATALAQSCSQGSIASCEMMSGLLREAAKDCATEQACIEAIEVARKLDKMTKSPENGQLYFSSVDTLCHTFKRGDACAEAAKHLQANNQPAEKVVEHVILACQHGHQDSCKLVLEVTHHMCKEERDPQACYLAGMEMRDTNPDVSRQLLRWSCEKGVQKACGATSQLGATVKANVNARPLQRGR